MAKQIKFTPQMLIAAKTKPVARQKQRSKYQPHAGNKEHLKSAQGLIWAS